MASTNRNWIPASYEALYAKSLQTKTYVEGHLGTMGINGLTAEWVNNTFKPAWQAFADAYLAWQDTGQRTPQKIAVLKETEKAFKPLYRRLYMFVKNNPVVQQDQLVAMGFPVHSDNKPTPVPVPKTFPLSTIDIAVPRRLTVHYVDSLSGKKGKPLGVAGALVRWAILPEPPVDNRQLLNTKLNTNSPFVVNFLEEERHQTCYFLLSWINTRGEIGASDNIISAVIP